MCSFLRIIWLDWLIFYTTGTSHPNVRSGLLIISLSYFIVFCPNLNFSQFYQKTGGVSREIPQDSSRSNLPSYFLVPISKMPFVFEFSFLFPRSYLGNAFCSRSNLKVTAYFCLAPIGDWEASRLFFRTFENILDSWSRLFHGRHFASRSFRHIELSEQDVRSFFLR